MSWSSAVNDFWFVELTPEDWFKDGPDLDARIRRRFESLYDEQRRTLPVAGTLDAAEHLAESAAGAPPFTTSLDCSLWARLITWASPAPVAWWERPFSLDR